MRHRPCAFRFASVSALQTPSAAIAPARAIAGARTLAALAIACALAPAMAADTATRRPARIVADPVLAPMERVLPATGPRLLGAAIEPGATPTAAGPDENPLLHIRLTDGRIWNPATQRSDRVRLRSYVADGAPPDPLTPFVAPTLRTRPGETVRIGLDNQLAPQPDCKPADINTPHCFNTTNLHSHGLWVSPAGNSDNVLLSIRPKVQFEYEYNIPATHAAGTFWYHPHQHGSTALQVSSGMAGALIIHGDRAPKRKADGGIEHGDIDTLLRDGTGPAFKERVVLFQQIAYACRQDPANPASPIKTNPDGTWACGPDDVGTIENYDQLGNKVWGPSGRYTSINGQIIPRFEDAQAGRIERWRTIHAGIRDSIDLQFVPMRRSASPDALRSVAQHDAWISQNCTGAPLTQFEIAADGLTRERVASRTQTILQPGYRSDLLMVFMEPGEYCVIDGNVPAIDSVSAEAESRRLLGTVLVRPGTVTGGDATAYLTGRLVASARTWMPQDVRQAVVDELATGLRLSAFTTHATVTDAELKASYDRTRCAPKCGQVADFNIAGGKFMVNNAAYNPAAARDLVLGNVEEWTLTSSAGSHPFHIHVNPFQVARILDPKGVDVSVPGSGDTEYADTKGVWKDTLFVKGGYTLYVRTRYQRYIGEYVLHCHILDHEDQGMMQNVRVLMPDGQGGGIGNGHH